MSASSTSPAQAAGALAGLRVLSLALNLPGPAALMRARAMGARCLKLEPPSGDPMSHYSTQAYADLHAGIEVERVDLKAEAGQARLREPGIGRNGDCRSRYQRRS